MEDPSILQSVQKSKQDFVSLRKKEPNCIVLGLKEIEWLKSQYGPKGIRNGIRIDGLILIQSCNDSFVKVGLIEEIGNVSYFRQ